MPQKTQKDRTNDERRRADKMPAAGPHDKPELTDELKTPGAGMLPPPGTTEESNSG